MYTVVFMHISLASSRFVMFIAPTLLPCIYRNNCLSVCYAHNIYTVFMYLCIFPLNLQRVSSVKDAEGRPVVVFSVLRWPKDDQDWLRMVIDALEVWYHIIHKLLVNYA